MKVRARILGSREKLCLIYIKIRFKLYKYDIRQFVFGTSRLVLRDLSVIADLSDRLLIVVIRLRDPCVKHTGHKTIRKPVVFICERNITEIRRHDPLLHSLIRYQTVDREPYRDS